MLPYFSGLSAASAEFDTPERRKEVSVRMFRDEEGQTLVFTAFLACCLFGFMALALDMGVLFRAHRKIQIAADAGAVAAGLAAEYNQSATCIGSTPSGTASTSVKCAAANAAAVNGVPGTQVTVNQPPAYGYHTGAEYIEVIVNQPNPTVFMAAFGGTQPGGGTSYKTMSVATRAVSGIVPGQNCMISLNPHVADAIDVQGNATIVTPNCSVQINSDNSTALCSTGNKSSIQSIAINIVGAQDPSGKCNKGQPNATTGVAPVPDPFANLQQPSCGAGNTFSVGGVNPTITAYNSGTGAVTLTNKAGTTVTATPAKQFDGTAGDPYMNVVCFSDTNISIASGLILGAASENEMFVFTGNLTLAGTTTINGTLDIAGSGTFTQGNQILNVVAPTTDQNYLYNGIALYYTSTADSCDSSYKGPDSACFQAQFGSGYGHLDGMVYAPNAAVYLQDSGGNSGPTVFTAVIADVLWDKSALLEITNNYNLVHTTSPLNHVALVE